MGAGVVVEPLDLVGHRAGPDVEHECRACHLGVVDRPDGIGIGSGGQADVHLPPTPQPLMYTTPRHSGVLCTSSPAHGRAFTIDVAGTCPASGVHSCSQSVTSTAVGSMSSNVPASA